MAIGAFRYFIYVNWVCIASRLFRLRHIRTDQKVNLKRRRQSRETIFIPGFRVHTQIYTNRPRSEVAAFIYLYRGCSENNNSNMEI
jgi:hypothetical protein